jgi:hypothetical protein
VGEVIMSRIIWGRTSVQFITKTYSESMNFMTKVIRIQEEGDINNKNIEVINGHMQTYIAITFITEVEMDAFRLQYDEYLNEPEYEVIEL